MSDPVLRHVEDLTNEAASVADDDYIFVSVKSGSSYISAKAKGKNARPRVGTVTYVDSLSGDDATAVAGSLIHTFKTVQAALNAASASVSSKNVRVFAGTYAESLTLKNNVNLYLDAGVIINSSGIAAQDAGQPVTCTIDGPGKIQGVTGGLRLASSSSSVTALCREIAASGGQPLILQDGTATIRCKLRSTYNNANGGAVLRSGGTLNIETGAVLIAHANATETIISANLAAGLSYDGSGNLSISVVAGQRYFLDITGVNDSTLVNGATTYGPSGIGAGKFSFVAAASSVALTGTASAACGVKLKRVYNVAAGFFQGPYALGSGVKLVAGAYEENSNLV